MGLEVQMATVAFNEGYTFTFSDRIQQYVAGISAYAINYGYGIYHEIQTLTVAVNVTGVSGNRISVAPLLILTNGSGNYTDSSSTITITVLAYTGSVNNDNLLLVNRAGDIPVTLPSRPLTVLPLLTGFSLSYADNSKHPVRYIKAGIRLNQNPYSVAVNANACMFDTTNNYAHPATIDSGLIVNCDPGLNLTGAVLAGQNGSLSLANNATFLAGFFFPVSNIEENIGWRGSSISYLGATACPNTVGGNPVTCQTVCWYTFGDGRGDIQACDTVDLVVVNF
jgi:hypothetical protein